MTSFQDNHLPDGWIQQFDQHGRPFYVDTKSSPPRSIWVHPYDDKQYLRDHPEISGELANRASNAQRRHSFNGHASSALAEPPKRKKGFIQKLMDKAMTSTAKKENHTNMVPSNQNQPAAYGMYGQRFPPQAYHQAQNVGFNSLGGVSGNYPRRRGGMGTGGMALPLMGGLAGGLLLGDMLDDNDGGNGFDGGDGGGDWGGGGDFSGF